MSEMQCGSAQTPRQRTGCHEAGYNRHGTELAVANKTEMPQKSRIIRFYRNESPDTEGRMLSEIWRWENDQLEFTHDYIQWLFPLDVESHFNPDAPLLTVDDRQAFGIDDLLQNSMRRSLALWLGFAGLELRAPADENAVPQIVKRHDFDNRKSLWAHPNHNWLRITRILKSLRLCGLENEARIFFDCLRKLHDEGFVSQDSFQFWQRAMESPPI